MAYVPAPKELPGFPRAVVAKRKTPMGGGLLRARWIDEDGCILEWDYRHGRVERYNARGHHLGEHDPEDGAETHGAISGRRVDP